MLPGDAAQQLEVLTFGISFHQSLVDVELPSKLKTLTVTGWCQKTSLFGLLPGIFLGNF